MRGWIRMMMSTVSFPSYAKTLRRSAIAYALLISLFRLQTSSGSST